MVAGIGTWIERNHFYEFADGQRTQFESINDPCITQIYGDTFTALGAETLCSQDADSFGYCIIQQYGGSVNSVIRIGALATGGLINVPRQKDFEFDITPNPCCELTCDE